MGGGILYVPTWEVPANHLSVHHYRFTFLFPNKVVCPNKLMPALPGVAMLDR